jgi:predicted O-methyltransferase YrrM
MELEIAQSTEEKMYIKMCIDISNHLGGDCAEVGVYRGGSANLICNLIGPHKRLYLFDTFAGFPELTEFDPKDWENDEFNWKTGLSGVYENIKKHFENKNVEIIVGDFPKSVENNQDILDRKFSFVHLDADAYLPTLNSLKFFYDRMSVGGVILFHDYTHSNTPVKKVVDEFLCDKIEQVIVLPTSQAFIIKQ